MDIEEKLKMQAEKYGKFEDVSAVTDALLMVVEGNAGVRTRWAQLGPRERTVLRGILTKLGRLLAPEFACSPVETYDAITGYAVLARNAFIEREFVDKQQHMDLSPLSNRNLDQIINDAYNRGYP